MHAEIQTSQPAGIEVPGIQLVRPIFQGEVIRVGFVVQVDHLFPSHEAVLLAGAHEQTVSAHDSLKSGHISSAQFTESLRVIRQKLDKEWEKIAPPSGGDVPMPAPQHNAAEDTHAGIKDVTLLVGGAATVFGPSVYDIQAILTAPPREQSNQAIIYELPLTNPNVIAYTQAHGTMPDVALNEDPPGDLGAVIQEQMQKAIDRQIAPVRTGFILGEKILRELPYLLTGCSAESTAGTSAEPGFGDSPLSDPYTVGIITGTKPAVTTDEVDVRNKFIPTVAALLKETFGDNIRLADFDIYSPVRDISSLNTMLRGGNFPPLILVGKSEDYAVMSDVKGKPIALVAIPRGSRFSAVGENGNPLTKETIITTNADKKFVWVKEIGMFVPLDAFKSEAVLKEIDAQSGRLATIAQKKYEAALHGPDGKLVSPNAVFQLDAVTASDGTVLLVLQYNTTNGEQNQIFMVTSTGAVEFPGAVVIGSGSTAETYSIWKVIDKRTIGYYDKDGKLGATFDLEKRTTEKAAPLPAPTKPAPTAPPPPTTTETRAPDPTKTPTVAPTPRPSPTEVGPYRPNDEYKNVQPPALDPDVPTYLGHTNMQTLAPTRSNAERMFSGQGGPFGVKSLSLHVFPEREISAQALMDRKPSGWMDTKFAYFLLPDRAYWITEKGPSGERLFIIEYALSRKNPNGIGKNVTARFYMSENASVWADIDYTRPNVAVYEVPGKKAGPDLMRWGGGDVVGIYTSFGLDGLITQMNDRLSTAKDGDVIEIGTYTDSKAALVIIPR